MQYLALFLSNNDYVEKCLSVIRLIGNPNASSFPHITLRLFKKSGDRLKDIEKIEVTHLNLIRPGTFNIEDNKPPFVVYIRCESRELELIEHKPDYPHSRLHITLYEGSDIDYAKTLFSLLEKNHWHFKLIFSPALTLTKKTIGKKESKEEYFNTRNLIFKEITNIDFDQFCQHGTLSFGERSQILTKVLEDLYEHFTQHLEGCNVESDYCDGDTPLNYQTKPCYFFQESPSLLEKPGGNGIFITPPEYAQDMAQCALNSFQGHSWEIDFADTAVGTGALFLATKYIVENNNKFKEGKYIFRSAIGIDIDKKMVEDALDRFQKRGLSVIHGDAISPNIKITPRNLMIVNPPYNRHEDIPLEYRRLAQELAEQQTGIKIAGDAGLYVYHMLIMDKWLSKGGVAAWLIPSIFLQSKYGDAIRQYLLNNVQLMSLHVYDYSAPQFEKAQTSTAIVVFKKQMPEAAKEITISFGNSAIKPQKKANVTIENLRMASENWQMFIPNNTQKRITTNSSNLKLEDLFDIKRGLATGANSFFVMKREQAQERGIPTEALKPLLPKARFLNNNLIINTQKDGYPDITPQLVLIDCDWAEEVIAKKYNNFFKYLETAKSSLGGKRPVIERTLVKSRRPWYKQEKREPCPFLLTYMGRDKKNLPPLYFILNKSMATALNTYLLLYPRKWLLDLIQTNHSMHETILSTLNDLAERLIAPQTRIYSEGLRKIEPGELKTLPISGFPDEITNAFYETQMKTSKRQLSLF